MTGGKIIDATLRFVDKFTGPMDKTISKMEKSARQYKRMGKEIQKTGKSITKVGSGLTKAVTIPIAGLGVAAMKTAADFEAAMSNVKAISGATGKDFDALTNEAIKLGASTAFSSLEVADAMTEMSKAGWNTQQILDGMSGVLDAAAASGEGLSTVSTIVADAITGFGLKAKDSSRVADLLTQAANAGTIGINDLGETFKYIAPVAQGMKLNIEDVTTAISAMSMAGIKGSQAGTSLRTLLTNLVKPTDTMAAAMERLGINVINQDGSLKNLNEIVKILRDSFSQLTEAERAKYAAILAGKTGMSGMLALLNQTEKQYNNISKSMYNSKGVADETARVMQDNLNNKIEQLGGSLESLAIKLGSYVIPKLTELAIKATEIVDKFTNLDENTQKTILKLLAIAAAAGPTILIFGKMVTGIGTAITMFGKFGGALGKGAQAVNKLSRTTRLFASLGTTSKSVFGLMITPGAKVILILAAIVAASILVYKNWGKIKNIAKSVGNSMKNAFLNSGIQVDKFKERFQGMRNKVNNIVGRLGKDFSKISKFLKPVIAFIASAFVAKMKVYFSAVAGAAGGLLDGISKVADGILTMFGGVITFVEGVFTLNWKKAFNGLKTFFSGWGQAVVDLVKTPINAIIGLINGAIDGINSLGLDIPDWVPGVGGKSFSINVPKIPMLYTGTTNWKGGPAMIHDRGAEIVDLPSGSRVYPHAKSLQMAEQKGASASKGVSITINKLADKIEVKSEGDIDAICETLVTKIIRIVENMPEGA